MPSLVRLWTTQGAHQGGAGQRSFLIPSGLVVKDNTLGNKLEIHLPPPWWEHQDSSGSMELYSQEQSQRMRQTAEPVLAPCFNCQQERSCWGNNAVSSQQPAQLSCPYHQVHALLHKLAVKYPSQQQKWWCAPMDTRRSIPTHTTLDPNRQRGDRPAQPSQTSPHQLLLLLLFDSTDIPSKN